MVEEGFIKILNDGEENGGDSFWDFGWGRRGGVRQTS